MGFFSRRDRIVDLAEDYHYDRRKAKGIVKEDTSNTPASSQTQESSAGGFFNFFNSTPSTSSTPSSSTSSESSSSLSSTESSGDTLDADEKRRRLAIRLKNMTDRIEDLSNQIYHLQQRIDLLERKNRVNSSGSEE